MGEEASNRWLMLQEFVKTKKPEKLLAELERNKLIGLLPQKKTDKIYERSPVDFALGILRKN